MTDAPQPSRSSPPDDEFLTVAEVAALLKLNQQTVRNWIDDRMLPAVRIGRRVRIRSGDLEAFVNARPTSDRRDSTGNDFWNGLLPAPALSDVLPQSGPDEVPPVSTDETGSDSG